MIGGERYFEAARTLPSSLADVISNELGQSTFFATGRDALFSLLSSLGGDDVLLPDLMCDSIIDATRASGKSVRFYNILSNFKTDFLRAVQEKKPDLAIVMHYFGILDHDALLATGRNESVIISDVTHLMLNPQLLSKAAACSDFLFASMRKCGPFPDGAFVASRTRPVPKPGGELRTDFFSLRAAAMLSRGFSASNAFYSDENYKLFRMAESGLDSSKPGHYRCSYLSKELMNRFDHCRERRLVQDNMAVLKEELTPVISSPSSPDFPAPYFVCEFSSSAVRDRLRVSLQREKIYCPIHWSSMTGEAESELSRLTFSIPCDSRYNPEHMKTISSIIRAEQSKIR